MLSTCLVSLCTIKIKCICKAWAKCSWSAYAVPKVPFLNCTWICSEAQQIDSYDSEIQWSASEDFSLAFLVCCQPWLQFGFWGLWMHVVVFHVTVATWRQMICMTWRSRASHRKEDVQRLDIELEECSALTAPTAAAELLLCDWVSYYWLGWGMVTQKTG